MKGLGQNDQLQHGWRKCHGQVGNDGWRLDDRLQSSHRKAYELGSS